MPRKTVQILAAFLTASGLVLVGGADEPESLAQDNSTRPSRQLLGTNLPPLTAQMYTTAPVPPNTKLSLYPQCPTDNGENVIYDVDHFLHRLESAVFHTQPFPYVYMCDMFRPDLYADMVRYFPPEDVMEHAVKRSAAEMRKKSYSAGGSNNYADRRYKISAYDILAMKATPKWPSLSKGKKVYERLKTIFFHKDVQGMLWQRFNLTRKAVFNDFRVQRDHGGYSIGVHPDSPKKILTMMFYIPLDNRNVYDYGTCLHTTAQFEGRDLRHNGQAPCHKKFMFASNTGYSFVVNDHSYHSVNTVGAASGVRQTVLVNWYSEVPKGSQPKSYRKATHKRVPGSRGRK